MTDEAGCYECDDPIAKYTIIVASAQGTTERTYCRRCYLEQP